ncbi:preprotein translocase subunit SecD/SecD/SecF fusion protein [Salsuginibacillus halophilus]|uniref:Protein translocase subunit SecD n=1 Tax=Salsuginibacillus halophilus TaxID=517424 RepID=A0A2P8HFZ1_9BACI|nr:protein translocase subunit SecD [Salsuginibacillus halophilus]PSL45114.1 preprotein translocase subunit SecD/SecD/SecF fusion protein [Salsuginibacillus halophilus]
MVQKWRILAFFMIVILLGGLISQTAMSTAEDTNLGLDLQGGFEILYEIEPAEEDQDEVTEDMLNATVSALNQRVNVLGVSEPYISIEGEDRIRVQLAGVEDQQQARDLLSTEAELTFRDVEDNEILSGDSLEQGGAGINFDQQDNTPNVSVTLQNGEEFGEATEYILENFDPPENRLVIWLDFDEDENSYVEEMTQEDPEFLSAPTVSEPLYTSNVEIQGDFTLEEAEFIAEVLDAGSLPVEMEEIYSNAVGASLGEEALDNTIYAGLIGIALILAYMMVYYRFMGVIAAVTLTAYIYIVMNVFNWIEGVLTLPGLAALILGVGMAVDANIITYERIKEELKAGRSVMSAFKAGARRSFTTILDANVTTILAAGVLFYFGTSSVQGFAVMLIVSILTSFLTAVYGSRLLLGLWVKSRIFNKKPGVFGVKESDIREL